MTMAETEYVPVPSPTSRRGDDVWPPKHSSVRLLPKTGFSPTVMREGSQGKKFVWPPAKGDSVPQSPTPNHIPGHVTQGWNPDALAGSGKRPPFAPQTRPVKKCTDNIWPPPTNNVIGVSGFVQPRPIKRVGRFEDYIKCKVSGNVPPTYRAPPGTQHIEYSENEILEYTTSRTTTQQQHTAEQTRSVVQQNIVEVEEEVEEEEVEEEEEEEVEEEEEEEEEA